MISKLTKIAAGDEAKDRVLRANSKEDNRQSQSGRSGNELSTSSGFFFRMFRRISNG